MLFFTICSNNYLAQAIVLGNSVKEFYPEDQFIIFLVDEKSDKIDYNNIPFEIRPVKEIEPQIISLVNKYNIIELNTCVKPRVIEYLFEQRGADKVIYFDPDIKVYAGMPELENALVKNNIVLTPHIYTPIPLDGKSPDENVFLNFGIYNLGFIGLTKSPETMRFVAWWKERTYALGYFRVADGIFVDQLWINYAPLFFKDVHILQHKGYNMAPWNLHERYLQPAVNGFLIDNEQALKFFHFSSFRLHSNELPVHYYDRFRLKDRPDLQPLYKAYDSELEKAGYLFYSSIPCSYVLIHQQYQKQQKKNLWNQKPLLKKVPLAFIRLLPEKWKKRLSASLSHN